jgi:hypothetical protein
MQGGYVDLRYERNGNLDSYLQEHQVTERFRYRAAEQPIKVLVDASLPPPRTCPDPSVQSPGYSCSSGWMDALYPAPSPIARVLVECISSTSSSFALIPQHIRQVAHDRQGGWMLFAQHRLAQPK